MVAFRKTAAGDRPVCAQHVANGRNDIGYRGRGASSELSRRGPNANLSDPVAFEHSLDRNLRADEGASGMKRHSVYHASAHQTEAGTDIAKTGSKQDPKGRVVDP